MRKSRNYREILIFSQEKFPGKIYFFSKKSQKNRKYGNDEFLEKKNNIPNLHRNQGVN